MKLKLGNCRVFVSPVFMGMLTVLLVIDQTGLMGRLLGAMAIHEAGHLTMMVLVGCSPKEMRFLPFEINIVADQSCANAWERFCISIGGIIVNCLVCLVFVGEPFGFVNLYLALFNSLPLYSMDGYQILSVILARKTKLVFGISALVTLLIFGVGGWMLVAENNPMLLLFSIYLLALGVMEKRKSSGG